MNIAVRFDRIAARQPEAIALITGRAGKYRKRSFRELRETADRFARTLVEKGVRRGDRVMLMVGPSVEFVALSFALFKIGAVVILIDPGMGLVNLRRCIGQVAPWILIGSGKALLFKTLCPAPFRSISRSFLAGAIGPWPGTFAAGRTRRAGEPQVGPLPAVACRATEAAAIIFTTGSTGPPKGVCYEHGMFQAQLHLIEKYYGIAPGDVDQPAFPLFALFSTALGATAVLPEMDPARPARVRPEKFVRTILDHGVTYSFGSPAIWRKVSQYCLAKGVTLPSLKKVLMAGAPVPGELVERVKRIIAPDGDIHTPYGATECLPIASMRGTDILASTWSLTSRGQGVCVGRSLPGIDIRVIETSDGPIPGWRDALELPAGQIGEIVARGPVVTRAYDHNDSENRLAKIEDGNTFWHRLGDLGYLDEEGRLWFCGRKAHRVRTAGATLFTVCCEAIFNCHPEVHRTALVGVGEPGAQTPVLIAEPLVKPRQPERLLAELRHLGGEQSLTREISHFLLHPAFPVDIRHNAKIFREKLAIWAAGQI